MYKESKHWNCLVFSPQFNSFGYNFWNFETTEKMKCEKKGLKKTPRQQYIELN